MKTFLSSLLIFLLSISYAQRPVLIKNNFEDLRNGWGWPLFNDNEKAATVKNNEYVIENKIQEQYAYFLSAHLIDYHKDFEIDVILTVNEGTNFSLTWGSDAFGSQYNSLEIKEKDFNISKWKDGTPTLVKKKSSAKGIYSFSQPIHIIIRNVHDAKEININEQQVAFSQELKENFGAFIGFDINGLGKVSISQFNLSYFEKTPQDIQLISKDNENHGKENLGVAVNTKYDELHPVISADGQSLFFNHSVHKGNDPSNFEDNIYFSEVQNNKWKTGSALPSPVNNNSFNDIISVLPDGNEIIVKGIYENSSSELSIYSTQKSNSGWTIPKEIIIDDISTTADHISYCMSPDHKVIISSLAMEDHQLDLYISKLLPNGHYSKPTLIEGINTSKDEETPFIAADNKTLYFSSDGHPGYGSHDIFQSKKTGDNWTIWSSPKNMGPEVNTPDWDAYYSVTASGEYAYLVSYSHSTGGADIFRMHIPEEAKPEPVVVIFGKVVNKKTKAPIAAEIHYYDITNNQEMGVAISNPIDGSYKIALPKGIEYGFIAEKTGYYSVGEHFDMTSVNEYLELEKTLYLAPIEEGQTIVLNNIFFETNKATLKRKSHSELDRLIMLMQDIPTLKIEIDGHTDNQGSHDHNIQLSTSRAKSVKEYIVSKDVNPERILMKGFGETQPIADNSTENGRQLNRRVEFKILKR